jgi:hypothetical protein
MRLDEWELSLISYPDYPPIRPFSGWSSSAATKSLDWYDAYNAVKHDREANLRRATFGNVLKAAAASIAMGAAQFGWDDWHPENDLARFRQRVFTLRPPQTWEPKDVYFVPEEGATWRRVMFPF